jgi:hypothetical protein
VATALSMITRSARLAGFIGKGETLDSDEAADGLTALNVMLDSWQLERLFVYQIVQGSYTWASGSSKTIGSGGDFDTKRPDRIDSAFIVDSNSQWDPLEILKDRAQYDAIVTKTTQSSLSQYLFMDTAYPLGVLYLYPVPSVSLTLKLNTWQTLQSFSGLTTVLALPPGYQRAIEYNLALEYGPEYGVTIHSQVQAIAMQSKANIKNINRPSMIAQVDTGVASLGKLGGGGKWNIYADS